MSRTKRKHIMSFAMACAVVLALIGCAATAAPVANKRRATDEAAIRGLTDGFVRAIRAKDLDGVMSVFAPDVVSFDLGPPLRHGGGGPFRTRWRELFESYEGT